MKIKVVGLDPSLRNWGVAVATYDTEDGSLEVNELAVIRPCNKRGKVPMNVFDLGRAVHLAKYVGPYLVGAKKVMVELPVGSQSSRAMVNYGMCLGVMGAIYSTSYELTVVTAREVKSIATGDVCASKSQMIQWATAQHPEVNWPTRVVKGVPQVVAGEAEHMADALAAVYAGLAIATKTNETIN